MKSGELHGSRLGVADSVWRIPAGVRAAVLDILTEDIDNATREKLRTLILNTLGKWTIVRFGENSRLGRGVAALYGNLSEQGQAAHPGYSDVVDFPTRGYGSDRNAVAESFTHHEIAHAVVARLLSDKNEERHAVAVELVWVESIRFSKD
jgi:hypothetical protein